jgi:formylglycine-generating enzyme required for sulfatase activity
MGGIVPGEKLEIFGTHPPHMVQVSPVRVAITPVSEAQFKDVLGLQGNPESPADYPVTHASFYAFEEFMRKVNRDLKPEDHIGFLTEAEGEHAARGPAVDVRQFMEERGLRSSAQLTEHLRGNLYYLENFIGVDPFKNPKEALALGTNICTDIESEWFNKLINGTGPVFAWYAFATLSGRLTKEEAWYDENEPAPVSLTKRVNRFGLSDMVGNVLEWRGDIYDPNAYLQLSPVDPVNLPRDDKDDRPRVLRGGSYYNYEVGFRAAPRYSGLHPDDFGDNFGCRVGAATPQDS